MEEEELYRLEQHHVEGRNLSESCNSAGDNGVYLHKKAGDPVPLGDDRWIIND